MTSIKIADLQPNQVELVELSDLNEMFNLNLIKGGFRVTNRTPAGMAIRTLEGLTPIGRAFMGGYSFGLWLNQNTSIQSWIASGLSRIP